MKFYTDPSFFFNLWMQSMIQFAPNHPSHRSGKQDRMRSPVKHGQALHLSQLFYFCLESTAFEQTTPSRIDLRLQSNIIIAITSHPANSRRTALPSNA
jgi:hypothetical protein